MPGLAHEHARQRQTDCLLVRHFLLAQFSVELAKVVLVGVGQRSSIGLGSKFHNGVEMGAAAVSMSMLA